MKAEINWNILVNIEANLLIIFLSGENGFERK